MDYQLKVPEALHKRVDRKYVTFIEDCKEELESVNKLNPGEYVGGFSKNQRSGQGMFKMDNGDLYKGSFKNDMRNGLGVCMFKSGALYKGDFKDDKPHGNGILYSGKNEIVEGRFDKGYVPNGKIRIMFQDGSYYEGKLENNKA